MCTGVVYDSCFEKRKIQRKTPAMRATQPFSASWSLAAYIFTERDSVAGFYPTNFEKNHNSVFIKKYMEDCSCFVGYSVLPNIASDIRFSNVIKSLVPGVH